MSRLCLLLLFALLTVMPAQAEDFGAIAVGRAEDLSTADLATGVARNYSSPQSAAQQAVKACQLATPYVPACFVVHRFAKGCAFITIGKNEATGTVDWAIGTNSYQAYQACRAKGLHCEQKTIGGCLKGYDVAF
jgi:hypothetical protein